MLSNLNELMWFVQRWWLDEWTVKLNWIFPVALNYRWTAYIIFMIQRTISYMRLTKSNYDNIRSAGADIKSHWPLPMCISLCPLIKYIAFSGVCMKEHEWTTPTPLVVPLYLGIVPRSLNRTNSRGYLKIKTLVLEKVWNGRYHGKIKIAPSFNLTYSLNTSSACTLIMHDI